MSKPSSGVILNQLKEPKLGKNHPPFLKGTYSVCHKFLPFGGSQIPLNPPLSKGDFNSNSLQFLPFFKGGQGGFFFAGVEPPGAHVRLAWRLQSQGRVSEEPVDFRNQLGGGAESQLPGKGQTRLFPGMEKMQKNGNGAAMPAKNPF